MRPVWTASALFKLVLATSNVFGTAISVAGIDGVVIFTLLPTTCVVARKYGAKLPDFVITFIVAHFTINLIESFTVEFQFFRDLPNVTVKFSVLRLKRKILAERARLTLSWMQIETCVCDTEHTYVCECV